jgi:hypothetical protein
MDIHQYPYTVRPVDIKHLRRVYHDFSFLPFHLDSFPGKFVQLLSSDPDSRMHRRQLQIIALKSCNCADYFIVRHIRRDRLQNISCDILCIGGDPQRQFSPVHLVLIGKELDGSGRTADTDRKDSRGHRIKGPGMSDLSYACHTPHQRYYIKGCHSWRF